jgi:hypothetical protein
MDIKATAKALQLSARADRRLVVSGKLQTDFALFILPEGSAPRLGDNMKDVNQDAAKKASTGRFGASPPVQAGDVKAPHHHERPSLKHAGLFVDCFL